MKKVYLLLFLLVFALCSCNYLVETIYDGNTLYELENNAKYHIEGIVLDDVLEKEESVGAGIFTKRTFIYYSIQVDEIYKGNITDNIIYLRYALDVDDVNPLEIGVKYHFYGDMLNNKIDELADVKYILNIESPNAQCFTEEEYEKLTQDMS